MPLLLRSNPLSASAALSMHFQSWSFQCIPIGLPHIALPRPALLLYSNSIYLIADPLRSDSLHCISYTCHYSARASRRYAIPWQVCALPLLLYASLCISVAILFTAYPSHSVATPCYALPLPFFAVRRCAFAVIRSALLRRYLTYSHRYAPLPLFRHCPSPLNSP